VFSSAVEKHVKIRIYKTIILPVVLYGCETWSLDIKGGTQTEGVLEQGAEDIWTEEGRGDGRLENCITRSFVICTLRQV
jgi:hypothetical protein